MEFGIDELNRIIMDVLNEPLAHPPDCDPRITSTTVKQESPPLPTTIMTNNITDRQYCLIIFNNRTWSQRLRKRPPQAEQQQQQQQANPSLQSTENAVGQREPSDASLDQVFVAQLRQLIGDYMSRTKRPFPIKYFLDFTTD